MDGSLTLPTHHASRATGHCEEASTQGTTALDLTRPISPQANPPSTSDMDTGGRAEVAGERIPEGTILYNSFEVGELLRTESHGNVYKVARRSDGENGAPTPRLDDHEASSLEARAFLFEGLSPALAKNRRRSMRRLRARSVAAMTWRGLEVIVYHTTEVLPSNSIGIAPDLGKHSSDDEDGITAELEATLEETTLTDTTTAPPKKRSAYQQESRKLRQRERRNRRKREPQSSHAEDNAGISDKHKPFEILVDGMGLGDDDIGLIMTLHFMHDSEAGDGRRQFLQNSGLKSALETYMSLKDEQPRFESEEHLREFLDIKECELASLNRRLAQMPTVLGRYNSRIKELMYEQMKEEKDSPAWKQLEPRKEVLMTEYKVLKLAHDVLPVAIGSAKEIVRSLRLRVERPGLAPLESGESAQQETAEERYERWKGYVVPSSAGFLLLESRLKTIYEALDDD
jgi:hypothetical protein